jgi:D-apionolactonase
MPAAVTESSPSQAEMMRLYGTAQTLARPLQLMAGPMRCAFEGGAIRTLMWHDVEILRGVSYLLRDRDWGTAPSTIECCEVEQGADSFRLNFTLRMVLPEGALLAKATVQGCANGNFSFHVNAHSENLLSTNRCGFVVLHPASAAGVPLQIEHTDATVEESFFPKHISPGQVAFNIRRLRHSPVVGLDVDCVLQADLPHDPKGTFEMEDQRNWSDASFKTYVASLLDPWPYVLQAGTSYAQSVNIGVNDCREAQSVSVNTLVHDGVITLGAATGKVMPPIGLGVPLGLATLLDDERQCVLALKPPYLVAEIDEADDAGLASQLAAILALSKACGARVQLDVICAEAQTPEATAQRVAQACLQVGLAPDAIRACPAAYLQSYQPSGPWPQCASLEDHARAFSRSFPAARIGGGMLTYFTELNRKRQSADSLAFVGHTTCPLVHAADDASVMQTHEALASIVDSVRNIWPSLAYRLGPVTLGMQRNPYGSSVAANPERVRMAMAQDDPRHHAAFGAAWIAGYAAAVIDQGLELLSFNHSHGISGPLTRRALGAQQPALCIPSWRVQAVLSGAAGCALQQLVGLPKGIAGIAWRGADGKCHMLLANLEAQALVLPLTGHWAAVDLSVPCTAEALSLQHPQAEVPRELGAYQVLWCWQ